jgi:type VI secretion system protein ImpH
MTPAETPAAPPPAPPRPALAGLRAPDASPVERLLAAPQGFEFHQAVRLLHTHLRRLPAPQRPVVRFRNTLSLAFPPSELLDIECHPQPHPPGATTDDGDAADPLHGGVPDVLERIELTPAFMGLLGSTGALPLSYSEQFAQRESLSRDGAARAFLDIFQHRAVTLFHEAWRKHRLPLQFESDRRERYLPLVLSLAGLGEPALRQRLRAQDGGVADDTLAFYAGLLQRKAVSAQHLQQVLADYFGVPVQVTQFVGQWFELDKDCQVTLGETPFRLGHDTVLGARVWQRDLRVRVSIGPVNRAQHQRFLPGGQAALALRELLTLVSGVSLAYEIRLRLRAQDVRAASLGGAAQDDDAGARLGWDSFLISHPGHQDREESLYDLHAQVG